MLLSVSMPVYNAADYLDQSIASVINQTYEDYELLLVNDGSKDDSLKICRKWESRYPERIRVVDKKNEGSLLTRKRCIEESSGEYIYIMDADDYLTENRAFEIIVEEINRTHVDMVFFNHVNDDGRASDYPFADREVVSGEALSRIYDLFLLDSSLYPLWNKVFRKNLINFAEDYTDYENIVYGTDLYQSIPVISRITSAEYLKQPFYHYRFMNNQKSIVHVFHACSYITAKKNQMRLERYAHEYRWNVGDLERKLTRIRMIRLSTAIYKMRLIDKHDRARRLAYIKEIAGDEYFRTQFSLKDLPFSRKMILLMTYLKMYSLLIRII